MVNALRHVHAAIVKGGEEYPQFRLVTRSGLTITTVELAQLNGPAQRWISVTYPVGVSATSASLSPAELQQVINALEKAAASAQKLVPEK